MAVSRTVAPSPAQHARLDWLEARFPATAFAVVEQDPHSRAVRVSASDAMSDSEFVIAANGRCVPEQS